MTRQSTAALLAAMGATGAASAGLLVQVEMSGEILFNNATSLPLALVSAGSDATITFTVDASDFVDDGSGTARGYVIDPSTFLFQLGSQTPSAQSPMPAGVTPYFVLQNGAGGDGFFLGTSTGSANGVPLNLPGDQGQLIADFAATYGAPTLDSTDIVSAVGEYGAVGLANFSFGVDDGGAPLIGVAFDTLTISVVPAPGPALALCAALGLGVRRRR